MIRIRAFRAPKDSEAAERYIEGYQAVLRMYGITKVTSANMDWIQDPKTLIILVESEDAQKVYGGCRLQIKTLEREMPMENAIAELDDRIYSYTEKLGINQVAELCGLWNSREIAGYGIGSIYLGRVSVAVSKQLGISNLMALCSPATLQNCLHVGFEVIHELGNNGTFYYPKEDLTATALIIRDLDAIPSARQEEKEYIYRVRENLISEAIEHGPKGEMKFYYQLRFE